jgi:hypothetical protein
MTMSIASKEVGSQRGLGCARESETTTKIHHEKDDDPGDRPQATGFGLSNAAPS